MWVNIYECIFHSLSFTFLCLFGKTRELLVDDLKVLYYITKLAFTHLKDYILRIILSLVWLFHFHLNIKNGLLHPFLMFAWNLKIKSPIKIIQLICVCELILNVFFHQRSNFSHLFENKWFQAFLKCFWKLFCNHCLVNHRCTHILFQQVVERYDKNLSFFIWHS